MPLAEMREMFIPSDYWFSHDFTLFTAKKKLQSGNEQKVTITQCSYSVNCKSRLL